MRPKFLLAIIVSLIIMKIYSPWFAHAEIIGGDWPTIDISFLKEMNWPPFLWETTRGNGLGGTTPLLNLEFYQNLFIVLFVQWIHIPWQIVYKVSWFGMVLIVSAMSIWALSKELFFDTRETLLAILIFLTNSYVLMLASGGQMGILLAVSISPLVLAMVKKRGARNILLTGLVMAVQILFDPRIAYITLIAVLLFLIFSAIEKKDKRLFFRISISGIIALSLNTFWILPTIVVAKNAISRLGAAYITEGAVKFFSFADFSHAIALLQPNWPENLFGKTLFLQPEFLILPIIAYAAMLFGKRFSLIYFFAFIGLLGSFLAKGANPPFGNIYLWLFKNFPGFIMFRDSTKFYLLILLSYSVLIPYTIGRLSRRFSIVVFVLFTIFWIFTIRQALFASLNGTFTDGSIPKEYQTVRSFILSQPGFFRTLWIPSEQRFTPYSHNHPSISASILFSATNSAELVDILKTEKSQQLLRDLSVKYIIIPYDSLGELFLDDRKYDNEKRIELEKAIDSIPWFTKVSQGNITVYQTPDFHEHFWMLPTNEVSYHMIDPSHYRISFATQEPATVYFSETYDPGWEAHVNDAIFTSQKTEGGINSFVLPNRGKYTGDIYFKPERFARIGLIISGVSLLFIVLFIAYETFFQS